MEKKIPVQAPVQQAAKPEVKTVENKVSAEKNKRNTEDVAPIARQPVKVEEQKPEQFKFPVKEQKIEPKYPPK